MAIFTMLYWYGRDWTVGVLEIRLDYIHYITLDNLERWLFNTSLKSEHVLKVSLMELTHKDLIQQEAKSPTELRICDIKQYQLKD